MSIWEKTKLHNHLSGWWRILNWHIQNMIPTFCDFIDNNIVILTEDGMDWEDGIDFRVCPVCDSHKCESDD